MAGVPLTEKIGGLSECPLSDKVAERTIYRCRSFVLCSAIRCAAASQSLIPVL